MVLVLGVVECFVDCGGYSVYCLLVYIDLMGIVVNVYCKLQFIYEEWLCWLLGDGYGLCIMLLGKFMVGGLNCWENWMLLLWVVFYGLGEDLYIVIWLGNKCNIEVLICFLVWEGCFYVILVSGFMWVEDIYCDFF